MSDTPSESYRYCEEVARREARNFYPCFWLLPPARRRAMCALYAFMRQTDDIADAPANSIPDERPAQRLESWSRELELSLDEGRYGPWPGWPALVHTVERFGIPKALLREVIEGVRMDLEPLEFATFTDLYAYCYRVASVVGISCLHIWGYRSEGGLAERCAEGCGVALQLTNMLRDVREDASRGRVYLPTEDLERFGVDRAELSAEHPSDRLRSLLAFEADRAYTYYENVRPLAPLVRPLGRPVLLAIVGVYRSLLDEIRARNYEVLAGRVSVPRSRKLAILARSLCGGLGWRLSTTVPTVG